MIVDLPLDDLCEDEQLLVDAAVAQVVVTEEAVQPVVPMILHLEKNKNIKHFVVYTFHSILDHVI